MNDPHVVTLVYRIEHSDSIGYTKAAPLCHDEKGFRLSIADAKVRFEMKDHFPTIEAADEALTKFRRLWEFDAQLKCGADAFRLVLDRGNSEIIDRNSAPGHLSVLGAEGVTVTDSIKLFVEPSRYPEPPSDIALTPDVEKMHMRYMDYEKGQDKLANMANFCLTVLEDSTNLEASTKKQKNRRAAAAKEYNIDKRVLDKIGCLAANKGGEDARKADGLGTEFSPQDRRFLEQAVKAVIYRMAERAYSLDKQLPMISLSELPTLDT